MIWTATRITSSAAGLARAAVLSALGLPAVAPARLAATLIVDNFESYADTAALDAVWTVRVGNNTQTFLDAGPAGSTNTSKTVHTTNRQGRRDRSFTPTLPT